MCSHTPRQLHSRNQPTMVHNLNEYHSMWFDPGGTLGWSWLAFDLRAFTRPEHYWEDYLLSWDCGEISGTEEEVIKGGLSLIDDMLKCVSSFRCTAGGEDFELTQLIGSKENLLSPVRQNAVFAWECNKRMIRYKLQARQLRTSVTRDRLKNWGINGRFKKDEFASLQHNVTWIRRIKKESQSSPWRLDSQDVINGGGWDCACARRKRCDLSHPR